MASLGVVDPVSDESAEQDAKVARAEDNELIQAFKPHGPDEPFGGRIPPRR